MACKIRVENFQSIREAEIEVCGFTAIRGPNNTGKSAFMRAIKGVFTNKVPKGHVHHGRKSSEVQLDFGNGDVVTWKKGDSKSKINEYEIKGQAFGHVGKKSPEEIQELGVHSIELGSKTFWPQIADQMIGQVFLLDESGHYLAEAVSDVENVSRLNHALKRCDSDLRESKQRKKVRDSDLSQVQKELSSFAGLEDVGDTLLELENKEKRLLALENKIKLVSSFIDRKRKDEAVVSKFSAVSIIDLPEFDLLPKLKGNMEKVSSLLIRKKQGNAKVSNYSKLLSNFDDVTFDDSKIRKIEGAIEKVSDYIQKHHKLVKHLSDLENASQILEKDFSETESELSEMLGDLGECPVCKSLTS